MNVDMAMTGRTLALVAAFVTAVPNGMPAIRAQAPAAPAVRVLTLTSRVFGNTRAVRIYLPPGYDDEGQRSRRYPVLYLNDGFAVFAPRLWDAPAGLDRLIRAGTVPPMVLVGIDNAASIDGAKTPGLDRTAEYLPYTDPVEPELRTPRGDRYPTFLFDEVMPLIEREVRVDPADVSVGGSSYGGIAALFATLQARRPIRRLLLESTPLFLFDGRLTRARPSGRWPESIYVGLGTNETDDEVIRAGGTRATEAFIDHARAAGVRTRLNLVEGAQHNSAAWRSRFPDAVSWLFGS